MQNSVFESYVPKKAIRENRSVINLAKGNDRPSAVSSALVLQRPIRNNMKGSQLLSSNRNKNNNKNIDNCSIRSESPALQRCMNSTTSQVSHCPDVEPKDVTPKQKNKFTRPRLNRLTAQRISRLRGTQAVLANAVQTRLPRKTIAALAEQKIDQAPSQQPFEVLQSQQEGMQSNFVRKVESFQELGNVYKLAAVNHANNFKALAPNDDLIALPNNLTQSVNELRHLCHDALLDGFRFISEQFEAMSPGANGEAITAACSEEQCKKLYKELGDKLLAVDKQLMKMCQSSCKEDTTELTRQIGDLTEANTILKAAQDRLDKDFDNIRKSRDELQQLVDQLQEQNKEMILELAEKNDQIKKQSDLIDVLRLDAMELKVAVKSVQEHVNESESNLQDSRKMVIEHQERIHELEDLLRQKETDQKNAEELAQSLGVKERKLFDQIAQIFELEKVKASLSITAGSEVNSETLKNFIQARLKHQQDQLEEMKQAEQMLQCNLETKVQALRRSKLDISHLEDQVEHLRQVLAVRGDRITYLDQEMKQRELDYNRRLTEIMAQSSEKEAFITQITNELASTNEQFQNLCTTIKSKQSKLNRQEHAIKLLEESNARSVMLHTKLGEKNSMLKDKLEQLRHMVYNLMIGSAGSEAELAEYFLE